MMSPKSACSLERLDGLVSEFGLQWVNDSNIVNAIGRCYGPT
jgi:hypothetical protein